MSTGNQVRNVVYSGSRRMGKDSESESLAEWMGGVPSRLSAI